MFLNPIKSLAHDLLSLVYMDLCIACYEIEPINDKPFCLSCLVDIPYIEQQSSNQSLLIGKKAVPNGVHSFYSLMTYTKSGKVKELLHQLKYCNRAMIGIKLGQQLGNRIDLHPDDVKNYILIPVPLHPRRQRKRGYNQASKIAEGIKNELKIDINHSVLKRIQNNESQTKKGAEEREDVKEQRFALREERKVDVSKHAIIIDDIITTGSTIAACYHLLMEAGYKKISVATLAITI